VIDNYFTEGITSPVIDGLKNANRGAMSRGYGYTLCGKFCVLVIVEYGNLLNFLA